MLFAGLKFIVSSDLPQNQELRTLLSEHGGEVVEDGEPQMNAVHVVDSFDEKNVCTRISVLGRCYISFWRSVPILDVFALLERRGIYVLTYFLGNVQQVVCEEVKQYNRCVCRYSSDFDGLSFELSI